jgi:hypothetical protein
MALLTREKVLLTATAVLLAVVGIVLLAKGAGGDSLAALRTKHDGLTEQAVSLKTEASPGRQAAQKLARWRARALPEDPELAHGLYNAWLELTIEGLKMRGYEITPSSPVNRGVYTVLRFKLQGQCTLDQLTRFLHAFYSTGYLHKVSTLAARPVADSDDQLMTVITVEALCVQGAEQQTELPASECTRLAHADPDEYLKVILPRRMEGDRYGGSLGLFASYVPGTSGGGGGPPPPPPPPPEFDVSRHTYVSSIQDVAGQREVWLRIRPQGKTLMLGEGDDFTVGTMTGKIARIRLDEEDIEFESDGGRWRLDLGKPLRQRVRMHE